MEQAELLERYARLAVRVGVNLQQGQYVMVQGKLETVPLVRAVVKEAYEAGARYVWVVYTDDHVRRSMIENVAEEDLGWTPPHLMSAMKFLEEVGGARISIAGDAEPHLMADLDPSRVGRAKMIDLVNESMSQINRRSTSWTIVACPNEGWATEVLGKPDVDGLWDAVARATRLYADDPVEAWWKHVEGLSRRMEAMNAQGFETIHFEGEGTDLNVGLHPGSRWTSGDFTTASGIRHVPNIPTEEVFTTPDFRRVEGVVTSTRPLQLPAEGVTVKDLRVTFENGRATKVEASEGGEVIETQMSLDEGGSRLGEVALVDRASAVGETGVTFNNTLFDENATSHIAYGSAYTFCVEGSDGLSPEELVGRGINHSAVHTDFMIGGPGVTVTGITTSGDRVTIIDDTNTWQL